MTDFSATLPHPGLDLTRTQLRENVSYLSAQPLSEVRDYQFALQTDIGYLSYRSEHNESPSVRKRAATELKLTHARFEMTVDAVMIKIS